MAVVVSLLEEDLPGLRETLRLQAPLADLVELRLDHLRDPDPGALRELIASSPRPVIATVHGAEGFGDFAGGTEERLAILRAAAAAGASWVDVDWSLADELGEVPAPCRRILSRHEKERTPTDLAALVEPIRARAREGDRIKLVTHARNAEEGLAMMRFLREQRGELIAFTSGAAGSFTRVLAPILGSPFTYAAPARFPDRPLGSPTAPGQLRVDELSSIAPATRLASSTSVFGVVGRPIGHSLSPAVHGAALRSAGLDAVYLAFEPEDFGTFLDLATELGLAGLSVTAPFKEPARARAAEVDRESEASGATNTLVREESSWRGHNTDAGAVVGALRSGLLARAARGDPEVPPEELTVLVVGAGGAARAAARAVRILGAGLASTARRPERAEALAAELGGRAVRADRLSRFDHHALVHCTPAGSLAQPGALPFEEDALRAGTLVVESVYRPLETPLCRLARARGCPVVDGGEWFVRQAAEQVRLFTSHEPDVEVLRGAFNRALEGERDE